MLGVRTAAFGLQNVCEEVERSEPSERSMKAWSISSSLIVIVGTFEVPLDPGSEEESCCDEFQLAIVIQHSFRKGVLFKCLVLLH